MAKISVELDTEENTLSVKVNGKDIGDVDSVCAFRYKEYGEDETKSSCTIYKSSKEDGVEVATQYYARGTKEASAAAKLSDALHDVDGFVGRIEKDASQDLSNFFSAKSRFR